VTAAELIGRDEESEVVDLLVGHITDGGGSLLIRGEPGIGKSAPLERARRQATAIGAQTLTAVGVEAEAEFAFAGLHQLPRPILARRLENDPVVLLAAVGTGYQTPIENAGSVRGQGSEALLKDEQEFVQASRSSALIEMKARLDELLIAS
jgi:hypothetical protein